MMQKGKVKRIDDAMVEEIKKVSKSKDLTFRRASKELAMAIKKLSIQI